MNSATNVPAQKVTAGAVAGAIVTLLVWFLSFARIDIPTPVAMALGVVITFGISYLTPPAPRDVPTPVISISPKNTP